MSDDINYMPILRSKQAEFDALQQIKVIDRRFMTPLIDVLASTVLPKDATVPSDITAGLRKLADNICSSWHTYPIFLDLRQVTAAALCLYSRHPLLTLWNLISQQLPMFPELRPRPIPVLGVSANPEYEAAVHAVLNTANNGLCLRLSRGDVQRASVWPEIQAFLDRMNCVADNVHLLVDYAYITPDSLPDLPKLVDHLPFIDEWRTFTIAGGSFPQDLTDLPPDSERELDRLEWKMWRDCLLGTRHLRRYPSFADYGIYYPYNVVHDRQPTPSASIRYAATEYWLVMRGRKICKANGGCQQYPRHAVALCERDEYRGGQFSAGDARIEQIAKAQKTRPNNVKNPGNVKEWLTIGFNHHVTLTAREARSIRATVAVTTSAAAA